MDATFRHGVLVGRERGVQDIQEIPVRELLRHLEFEFTRFREHDSFYDMEVSTRAGDIDKWKQDFHDVLDDELGRCVLLKFMMMERNEENLLFFLAVQKMKSLEDVDDIKGKFFFQSI